MEVKFKDIHHLEEFLVGGKKFIKIADPILEGGGVHAIPRPGTKGREFFPPEAPVQRIRPGTAE